MQMKLNVSNVKIESFANRSFNLMGPQLWKEISNKVRNLL